ncbi:MAG TPA: PAS domain S-box protein [Xanthobacteraceae bacterium]|nr:PAS domain S-box protein [Xanthobacteraceae bacterium]
MTIVLPSLGSTLPLEEQMATRLGQSLLGGDDFFRAIVDALPAAIYTTDRDGRITYYNEAAAQLWGHRPELGRSEWCGSWKLFWPDGVAMLHSECPMAVAVKEQRAVRGAEAIAERPDGTRTPFIPFPTPIYDSQGQFIGAVNLLVDITDRKRAEDAMQRLASIVESSDDAIVGKNLDGIITSWNKGAERIFGYLSEEIVGRPIKTLIPLEYHSEEEAIIERIKRGQRVEHYETVRQRKHGSRIEVSLTVSPIKDSHGKIVGASKIARDISDRRKGEAQLALLAREAEHRTKNVIATVQAAVRLTRANTGDEFRAAIEGRIQALANVHALFVESQWTGADLRNLIVLELSPYSQATNARARIDGPDIKLEPGAAQSMAVAIHELATNAAKYGALSKPKGRVEVEWAHAGERLTIRWSELDGPAVQPPKHHGFGMRVIENMIRGHVNGDVRFDWLPAGLSCEITLDGAASLAR